MRGVCVATALFVGLILTAPGVVVHAQTSAPAQAPSQAPLFDLERIYDFAAETLAVAIRTARDEASAAGTEPIPETIRAKLNGAFAPELLARVRYRIGEPGSLLVQAFAAGNVQAVTLIDVILFRNAADAETDDALWAHELTHVRQYDRWGLEGFARRYVRDSQAVEAEAYDFQAEHAKRRGRK